MDFSSDDYFGTLGGSLMKDLLADLQVEDGDFSLEQLEKELAQLDQNPPQLQPQPFPTLDAASLVVSHAQQLSAGASGGAPRTPASNQGVDAWSLSLQNFTALSLQDDFLAADSARKQKQHHTGLPDIHPTALDGAEDYDIQEKQSLLPPPGLGGLGLVSQAETAPVPKPPNPKAFPRTPQNSMSISENEAANLRNTMSAMVAAGVLDPGAFMPAGSIPPQQSSGLERGIAPPPESIPPQTNPPQGIALPAGVIPPQSGAAPGMAPPTGTIPPQGGPLQGAPPPQGVHIERRRIPPGPGGMIPGQMPPQAPGQPVLVAMPAAGPAWQTPRAPPPPSIRVFCNPHPVAPPIPAAALETKFMNARDIAYVIHSILKPVLAEVVSENDYYVQFLRRMGGPQANPRNRKQTKDTNEEMTSRANKTREWASEKGVLGHVAKANVARPRALIATPQAANEQDTEQKQRASLWKARVYCDQAYQSYQMVVDIWRSAPPGGVPPQVQLHLVKLMKCMGITLVDKDYQLDAGSLSLLIKLSKGRTLIARVLEQALLPPNAVQALLPTLLEVLLAAITKKSDENKSEEISNERLFRAIAGVVQKLNTSSETLLKCVEAVRKLGKASLSSTARMECVHTLLQKGSMVAGQDPSQETRVAWGKAESEFMALLQAY